MLKSLRVPACASAVLLLALTACSSGSDTASSTPTPSGTTSSTPTTPTPPPATTPSVVPSTPPPAKPARTAAQLTKALLELKDLPSGFSVETEEGGDDSDVKLTSKDRRCAKMVAYSNADNPPGSKASATRSFSGGAQGPFIDESIDAMGSVAAVAALQRSFQQAVANCRTMTLTMKGEGSSPISVRTVSAPKAGTNPVAVRLTATSGPLAGLEVTMVTTGVDDVVVALTVMDGLPEDIDGATTLAVDKAKQILGATTGGA